MLPDRVSNPGPLTYESGALPIALRGPASHIVRAVAISQMFNHVQVQLHVHWMHLLNTRIYKYICIYITPTVQTLHYCPAGA